VVSRAEGTESGGRVHFNERLTVALFLLSQNSSLTLYVVDRNGQLATHPGLPSAGKIIDYSAVPVVQKVLRQQSGVEIMVEPMKKDERVAAYAPIAGLGWGVIATEPVKSAFATREENLARLLTRYGLIFLLSCVLAYVILRTVIGLKAAEERILASEQRVGAAGRASRTRQQRTRIFQLFRLA
jgi:hypothetical protein